MSAGGIYKPGQGYWTRTMSAIAYAILLLMGVVWLWKVLANAKFGEMQPVYVQMAGAIIVAVVFGSIGYYLIGRKRTVVDFMIATEGELKKVNWSTRREVLGSTWMVIGLCIFLSALVFVADYLLFTPIFKFIGVLDA